MQQHQHQHHEGIIKPVSCNSKLPVKSALGAMNPPGRPPPRSTNTHAAGHFKGVGAKEPKNSNKIQQSPRGYAIFLWSRSGLSWYRGVLRKGGWFKGLYRHIFVRLHPTNLSNGS